MKKKLLIILMTCFATTSCNLFEEMSSTDTDEAILYSARMSLAEGNWNLALSKFAQLSAATLAIPSVVIDKASAYSGRCGLDFFALVGAIQGMGATNLMDLLSDNFVVTTAANAADCKLAEDLLKSIANGEGVVSSERGQFLMAFSSLAKIGSILNFYSDTDDNGVVDAAWEPCNPVTGPTDLPVNDVNEIGTAIVLFYKNLRGTTYGAAITASIDAVCTDPLINGSIYDFCDIIDTTGMTADHRQLIRGIIRETTDGMGLALGAGGVAANACQP